MSWKIGVKGTFLIGKFWKRENKLKNRGGVAFSANIQKFFLKNSENQIFWTRFCYKSTCFLFFFFNKLKKPPFFIKNWQVFIKKIDIYTLEKNLLIFYKNDKNRQELKDDKHRLFIMNTKTRWKNTSIYLGRSRTRW